MCNGLAPYVSVTMVPIKSDVGLDRIGLDARVEILSLAQHRKWKKKYQVYRETLSKKRERCISISFCCSADVFNSFFGRHAIIMSSVRGNLLRNYHLEYGAIGILAAVMHYLVLVRFRKVLTISQAMRRQLVGLGFTRVENLGNFLDEKTLERERITTKENNGDFRFVFIGRLTRLKRPDLLVDAIAKLRGQGIECRLGFVGSGKMRDELEIKAKCLGVFSFIDFYGYVPKPYEILQNSDCLVLPSETEGISRAGLEALFFGVPAIMRRVDGNSELVTPGVNGELFEDGEDLSVVMAKVIKSRSLYQKSKNLLPDSYRQEPNIRGFISMVGC